MSMEMNKIAGAVLLAGIVAMTSGMLAGLLVHPHKLEHSVYKVEGVAQQAAAPAAPAKPEPIAPLLAAADVKAGEAQAKKCAACHTFTQGGPNRVGPNLWNIVGNKHAHAEGFAYSNAMKEKAGQEWTYEELSAFIANPRTYLPGTKMAFAGIPKAADRAALLAYLRTLSDSPKPLP